MFIACILIKFLPSLTALYAIFIFAILLVVLIASMLIIWRHPENASIDTFKAPFLPFVALMSVLVNFYLMTTLSAITWLRFILWLLMGNSCCFLHYLHFINNSSNDYAKKKFFFFFLCRKSRINNLLFLRY
jgi:basic amino acid/polyamine antiporter, APA family